MVLEAHIPPTRQMAPVTIVTPGSRGLNTLSAGALIDKSYAVTATNAVVDANGRLATRNGFTLAGLTTNATTYTVGEYNAGNGVYYFVTAALQGSVGSQTWSYSLYPYSGTSPTNSSLTATTSAQNNTGRPYFQNFNNRLVIFNRGGYPTDLYISGGVPLITSYGAWPVTSGVGCCAFGRVWSVSLSDEQTITYSGLLNINDVSSSDAGIIDMHTIWSNGTDRVTAIFPFNGALVVCGTKHIVMFTDGRGSTIGVDPTQMYVFDTILGTGCLSQWTVDYIGQGDVLFLSSNGVQSLARLTQNTSNPTEALTKYVNPQLLTQLAANVNYSTSYVVPNQMPYVPISGSYNNLTGQYLLHLPANSSSYCVNMRRQYPDDTNNLCGVVTLWSYSTAFGPLLHSITDHYQNVLGVNGNGTPVILSGYADAGNTYGFVYQSPWFDFSQFEGTQAGERLKLLKRIRGILAASGTPSIALQWNTDFGTIPSSTSVSFAASANLTQFGISQFGSNSSPLSQFGGGSALQQFSYDARARGQYYQMGITATVSNYFAIQQLQLDTKLGRIT